MMRISVVEDNQAVLEMVGTALVLHGHVVEMYGNSPSFFVALRKAERTPPYDLVIVDLFLNRHLGTDILEALHMAHPRAIPAILISAAEESAFTAIRKRFPNLPILQKPFNIQGLVALINETTASPKT